MAVPSLAGYADIIRYHIPWKYGQESNMTAKRFKSHLIHLADGFAL